jgi:type IV pilus assembly protein PilB
MSDAEFKDVVLKSQLLDNSTIAELVELANYSETTLYDIIIDRKVIDDEKIGEIVARHFGKPFVNLSAISIPDNILHILPERMAKKRRCIVFERVREGLKIAMEDPRDEQVINALKQKTNSEILVYYATPRAIQRSLDVYKIDIKKVLQDYSDEAGQDDYDQGDMGDDEEAPISQLADILFEHAYREKASDIHIEPQEDSQAIVRYRVDGVLHDIATFPRSIHERVMSRLKVLAKLRTDEHHATQDGKIRASINGQYVDIRLSILPIVDGEKAVMRVLSTHGRPLSLVDLGMRPPDLQRVKSAYERSFGMLLSTGPTGSGKSTSIYAILRILNVREKNITTIEDPVEYRIKGINQINVNPKAGLTFAAGLRSILRQDPNIVFVGEIRDGETANIAVNAALTGHLVLSTLHTNDAATAVVRLIDMKVEPFLVASTVNVIIAQRLVRRVCQNCRVSRIVKKEELIKFFGATIIEKNLKDKDSVEVFSGVGCKLCGKTGYLGRVGLFEVLLVSQKIKELTINKANSDAVAQLAIEEGMTTMPEDGLIKVMQGATTVEEVMRVTKTESV